MRPGTLPTREAEALAEVASTRVGRANAATFVAALLLVLIVGPGLEAWRFWQRGESALAGDPALPSPRALFARWRQDGARAAHRELRAGLLAIEERLGRASALSSALRAPVQRQLVADLGYGNSQVFVGRHGWLYYRTELDYLAGAPFLDPNALARRRAVGARYPAEAPDPIPAIVGLSNDLARRGIELVLVPIPVKASIHPEELGRSLFGGVAFPAPPENPSFASFVSTLEAAGVAVFDPTPTLRRAALAGERPYLPTDTHWSPHGLQLVAADLASYLHRKTALAPEPWAGLQRRTKTIPFEGDLIRLLGLGTAAAEPSAETLEVAEVVAPDGTLFDAGSVGEADVLLVGDSYSLVYSHSPGGRAAGFGEELAAALERPVRSRAAVVDNDLADRVHWLRDEPQLLDGVRVLVYQVTSRAFVSGEWSATPLAPPTSERSLR